MSQQVEASAPGGARRSLEVFRVFLRLGLTSFGGPIAHLGYFRAEFIQRRGWLTDRDFGDIVALSQFLPGPASSKVGFAIGLHRAGMAGALAAFVAFTLPSAALLVAFAYGAALFAGPIGSGVLRGLEIAAVAIVAQAVWGMARTLTPDRARASIAAIAAVAALVLAGTTGQLIAIAFGALAGLAVCREPGGEGAGVITFPVSRFAGAVCLGVFAALLLALPLLADWTGWGGLRLFDVMYRAGALVFGGGHVLLPLLAEGVVDPGWITQDAFLAGYGAAQAVPGPLFTFAGYLGAISTVGPGGIAGAAIALLGVFLPGFLLLVGILPFWNSMRERPGMQALMRGAGAAVVGILAAALYTPVFLTAIVDPASFALALICFVLLIAWRAPSWAIVVVGAVGGIVIVQFL